VLWDDGAYMDEALERPDAADVTWSTFDSWRFTHAVIPGVGWIALEQPAERTPWYEGYDSLG
jgi:hypothetical protein